MSDAAAGLKKNGRPVTPMAGRRFGMLTVTGPADGGRVPCIRWLCDCDCGTRGHAAAGVKLRSGRTLSCGCTTFRPDVRPDTSSLIGLRFSHLVVTREVAAGPGRGRFWECVCDCGCRTTARTVGLRRGYTRSCGCLSPRRVIIPTPQEAT